MTCPACPAHPASWKLENRGTGVVAAAALRAELDQVLQEVENKEALGYSWGMPHMPLIVLQFMCHFHSKTTQVAI
jgi:hypothetical protein